jgi:hypothetical protein
MSALLVGSLSIVTAGSAEAKTSKISGRIQLLDCAAAPGDVHVSASGRTVVAQIDQSGDLL